MRTALVKSHGVRSYRSKRRSSWVRVALSGALSCRSAKLGRARVTAAGAGCDAGGECAHPDRRTQTKRAGDLTAGATRGRAPRFRSREGRSRDDIPTYDAICKSVRLKKR
jgi:hypothetical protein